MGGGVGSCGFSVGLDRGAGVDAHTTAGLQTGAAILSTISIVRLGKVMNCKILKEFLVRAHD
jgi:hypothetical protein